MKRCIKKEKVYLVIRYIYDRMHPATHLSHAVSKYTQRPFTELEIDICFQAQCDDVSDETKAEE